MTAYSIKYKKTITCAHQVVSILFKRSTSVGIHLLVGVFMHASEDDQLDSLPLKFFRMNARATFGCFVRCFCQQISNYVHHEYKFYWSPTLSKREFFIHAFDAIARLKEWFCYYHSYHKHLRFMAGRVVD